MADLGPDPLQAANGRVLAGGLGGRRSLSESAFNVTDFTRRIGLRPDLGDLQGKGLLAVLTA